MLKIKARPSALLFYLLCPCNFYVIARSVAQFLYGVFAVLIAVVLSPFIYSFLNDEMRRISFGVAQSLLVFKEPVVVGNSLDVLIISLIGRERHGASENPPYIVLVAAEF